MKQQKPGNKPGVVKTYLPYFLLLTLLGGAVGARGQKAPLPPIAAMTPRPYVAVLVWHDVLPKKQVWFDTTDRKSVV